MEQQTFGGETRKEETNQKGDSCSEAVMAAMQAIGDHCDADGVPLQLNNGIVTMVPKDEMPQVQNMAPDEMSDRELMDFIRESPWLDEWTEGLCKSAGHDAGTTEYEECRLQFAREALS